MLEQKHDIKRLSFWVSDTSNSQFSQEMGFCNTLSYILMHRPKDQPSPLSQEVFYRCKLMKYVDNTCYFYPFSSVILKNPSLWVSLVVYPTRCPFPSGICKCKCKDVSGKYMVNIYDLPLSFSSSTLLYFANRNSWAWFFVCLETHSSSVSGTHGNILYPFLLARSSTGLLSPA